MLLQPLSWQNFGKTFEYLYRSYLGDDKSNYVYLFARYRLKREAIKFGNMGY